MVIHHFPAYMMLIFQCCNHHFQCIEPNIQLLTQYHGHNPPIQVDERIETLFISWCDSYSWLSGML